MKKLFSTVVIACSLQAFASNWPLSVVGTWQGVANRTTVKLTITSQGTTGACKPIIGTLKDVPSGGESNVQGFYCPKTGRISFVRKDVHSNAAFQSYSGNLSDVGAELRMAGTFGELNMPDDLGDYGFAMEKRE